MQNLDTGLAVVIAAVLFFYLRLILLQRERVKRVRQAALSTPKKKKNKPAPPEVKEQYSVISQKRSDQIIAGIGLFAILVGVLLNAQWFALIPGWQAYWWVPTAAGIILFSWGFKL